MGSRRRLLVVAAALTAAIAPATTVAAGRASHDSTPALLVSGLAGGSGSAIGPDGALYVPEPVSGEVTRVDPRTGAATTFATGLPVQNPGIGLGGAMDVAFLGRTLYALVTLVGEDTGGTDTVGVYRMDSPTSFSVVADIGAFTLANPPDTDFFVQTGVQYALQSYLGAFLVTDGHHNRVYRVTPHGQVTELIAFDNIVPTGLDTLFGLVFMSEAGPVPHLPDDGRVVAFWPPRPEAVEIASGAPLLVDVEFGRGLRLYALSQGHFTEGNAEGSPADPDTGALVRVKLDGGFAVVADGLDRPTSLEILGSTAFVVTLDGEVWKIPNI
jgi:hypothetical protein